MAVARQWVEIRCVESEPEKVGLRSSPVVKRCRGSREIALVPLRPRA